MSTALKDAIKRNDAVAVGTALKGVKDVNRKLSGASAPLAYACEVGADKVLETLIKAGAVAEKKNDYGLETPFWAAAQKNHFDVLKRMMELKVVSERTLKFALEHACYEGRPELLEFLIKETKRPVTIEMMRLAAVTPKALEIIKALLKNGGNANMRFDKSDEAPAMTPLHEFADSEKPALVRVLIESGAEVNAQDGLGRTPLMIVAKEFEQQSGAKQIETLKILLDLGADATLKDNFGNDALDYLTFEFVANGGQAPKNVVEILRKAGAKGSSATMDLFAAVRAKDRKKIEAALKNGAEVNRVAPGGRSTPLGWTASRDESSEGFMELLLTAGADPNVSGKGDTLLIYAARIGNAALVRRLVAAGAKVDAVYRSGEFIENAYSASEGKPEIRDILKSVGAKNPEYEEGEGFEAGVASWNDFSELLVKTDVKKAAEGLARFISGKVKSNAYGQSVTPGKRAYVVIRPAGMKWTNVFQIAPPLSRFEDLQKKSALAAEIANSCKATVLSIDYSDTSDTAAVVRVEPGGKKTEDKGWDAESLQEMVDTMGDEAPEWARKKLAEADEDGPSSTDRLKALAKEEKFVVAAFGFSCEPGRKLDVEVTGYGAEAFDGVAFVTN